MEEKQRAANRKKSDEIKEQAILLYATSGNITETARTLNIAKSTVFRWINEPERSELVEQMRTEKRVEFADRASGIIEQGLNLLERRIGTALEHENELEQLLCEVAQSSNLEIPEATKRALISKIKSLEVQKLGDITTAVGTMYDKRALARGEITSNNGITIELAGEIKNWAK